ncbi:PRAME family member 12 [Heterocephalus glaber]|uniref:PRAME family member 12 n=1 Tax=Heterocephalus glaber TaxID=10181 RepID=G5AYU9_HETGA|nr:PRAME family member 12 [Heterocephalus glaber]
METQRAPTVEELLGQRLLRNVAPNMLDDLPLLISPELFKEAFTGGHVEVLKAMVQAWPFPCLPLGALMKMRRLETSHTELGEENLQPFKAVLAGLDALLALKDPSRWQLKVLDLRDVHGDFWSRGPGAVTDTLEAEAGEKKAGEAEPGMEAQPALRVLAHLCLEAPGASGVQGDGSQGCLLEWAGKRTAAVHLCCEKVTIESSNARTVLRLLCAVQLDSVRELVVHSSWNRDGTREFFRELTKMTNLQTFHFSSLSPRRFPSHSKNKRYSRLYATHLAQLQGLREFHVDDVFFLRGRLHKILRSATPLESLSLSSSPLREGDLLHLTFNPTMSQLKHLLLRKFSMKLFSREVLPLLLEQAAGTLETLALEHCELTNAKLLAILPALSLCSRLQTFSCYGNHISLGVLQKLLRVTLGLSQITQGLYPAPRESYEAKCVSQFVCPEQFPWVRERLTPLLKDIRPSLRVRICTYSCDSCTMCQFYSLEPTGSWEVTQECRYGTRLQCQNCVHPELGTCNQS